MKKLYLFLSAAAWAWLPLQALSGDVLELPFHEVFPTTEDIADPSSKWTILNHDNDGYMYEWLSYQGSEGFGGRAGYAQCQGNVSLGSDDYLTTKPIRLPKGTVNLTFYYKGGYSEKKIESMEVLFGKSTEEVTALKPIMEMGSIGEKEWTFAFKDVEVPEDGTYCFSFHSKTPAMGLGSQICLDEVRIEAGAYRPVTELAAVQALLPRFGCTLTSAERVGMTVANTGTKTVDAFSASYAVNGGTEVKETFTAQIEPGDSTTVWFSQKADFSTADTEYKVTMQAATADQLHTFNDTCSAATRNVSAKTAPYSVKFAEAQGLDLFWWPADAKGEGWKLSGGGYKPAAGDSSVCLTSGCFDLGAWEYKLQLNLSAGSWGSPEYVSTDLLIRIGESGTDVQTWDTIADMKKFYTEWGMPADWAATFKVKTPGSYAIAIQVRRNVGTVLLNAVSLDVVPSHEVAIASVSPSAVPRLIPIGQLEDMKMKVLLTNQGTQDEKVTLTVRQGGEVIFTSSPIAVLVQEKTDCELPLPYKDLTVGGKVDVEIEASIETEDATPDNNRRAWSFTVTDTEYAYDNITAFEKHTGDKRGNCGYGRVFDVPVQDTLTAVKLAFAAADSVVPFKLNVYAVDDVDVTRLLHSEEMTQRPGNAFNDYPINPLLLRKGRYFVEVEQEYKKYLGLCYESVESGTYHMRMGWEHGEAFFNPDSLMTIAGANLGIRPLFASGSNPVAVDLEAVAYEAPLDANLMWKEEPVRVEYRNQGFGALEDVTFHCLVDGVKVAESKASAKAYDRSFTVEFTADLTAVGEHELTVYPVLDADENHANDTIRKAVVSMAEADPYKLDFEQCHDFATDRMNPQWQSIDRDGGVTGGYGFMGYTAYWPGNDKPFGFVAFNPDETIPMFPDFFTGYHGKRFGASFFVQDGNTPIASDDWLISPKLALGGQPELRFRIKSQTDAYGLEDYKVYVSTTGTEEEDFVLIGGERQAPAEWEEVVVRLDDYRDQSVHVAIRCVSEGKFILLIDDIEVVKNADRTGLDNEAARPCTLFVDPQSVTLHVHAGECLREVVLYDTSGRQLMAVPVSGENCTVDLAGLPAGVYACRIHTAGGRGGLGKFMLK